VTNTFETRRRRTFAIISHPDAGKATRLATSDLMEIGK
jgi:peptide subunit release factor RF-3